MHVFFLPAHPIRQYSRYRESQLACRPARFSPIAPSHTVKKSTMRTYHAVWTAPASARPFAAIISRRIVRHTFSIQLQQTRFPPILSLTTRMRDSSGQKLLGTTLQSSSSVRYPQSHRIKGMLTPYCRVLPNGTNLILLHLAIPTDCIQFHKSI